METSTSTGTTRNRVALRRLMWVVPLAVIAAVAANLVINAIGSALGTMPDDVVVSGPGGEEPITAAAVIFATLFGTLAGAIVFTVICWLTSRPIRIFRLIAALALILSLFSPFSISDAPADMIATLVLMHIVAAVVSVGILTTLVQTEERE